jgi:hypothetical protein
MAKPPAKSPKATPAQARAAYEKQRQRLVTRYADDPEKRKAALAAYESDPRIQNIRRIAGMPTVTTRRQAVKETARRVIAEDRAAPSIVPMALRDAGGALLGSANDALFGLPARGAAAILGIDNELMQEFADQQGQRNSPINLGGTLGAGFVTGSGVARGLAAGGAKLAATGAPLAQEAGNVLQSVFQLRRGQNAANAAKLAGTGAAFGGATEAGKGRSVVEGAAIGAGTGLALGAGYKGGKFLYGKASDVLRLTGADDILRSYTNTTREALQSRIAAFRKQTGAEPTMYELLDLSDRQSLQKVFGRLDRGQQERGAELARARVEAIPGEVAQLARNATRGQRKRNISNLASEQAASRGAPAATTAEARLAVGAADNPTRLAQLRRQEARNIMGPFDERKAVDKFGELVPSEPRALNPKRPGEITDVPTDPEMAAVIKAAAGSARIRTEGGEGLTVREVTGMIQELKSGLTRGSVIERGVAQRAIDHLEGVIATRHPDVAPALARMNEAWAARSRQIEGMLSTRNQADVNPNTARNLQRSENIYETPEGAVGRAAGQRTELLDDLGAANSPALGTVRNLAESQTEARRIAQNIGVPATRQITEAARAQSESARRLATAVRDPKFDVTEIESGDLALLAAGLNPSSMAYTKAKAFTVMLERFGSSIPQTRSRAIVDMLFSRDPAMTQRAINALRSQQEGGREALRAIINAASTAVATGTDQSSDEVATLSPETAPVEEAQAEVDYTTMSDEELLAALEAEEAQGETDYSTMSDEELLAAIEAEEAQGPYGRRVIESLFPDAVITDDNRDPDSDLGRKNPGSYHVGTDGAVDVRPIPGMTFNEFVETLKAEGYNVVEAIDETGKGRSKHATGPHWHVVIGE